MLSGNFKTARNNLRTSKWRSLLTMLGVIIGITLVVTIVSLGEGLKKQVVGQVNHLGSDVLSVRSGKLITHNSKGQINSVNILAFLNSSTLTAKDVAALNQLKSVGDVTPIDFVTSNASSDEGEANNAFVLGTSSSLADILQQKLQYGDFFDDNQSGKFAVIGSGIAHRLYGELNPTGHEITISGQTYIVRGVLATTSGGLLSIGQTDFNSAVLIPFQQAITMSDGGTNILQILLKSNDPNSGVAINDVQKTLLESHQGQNDFTVLKQDELLALVNGLVNKLTAFISAIAAISLLVGGIGIMDIMLASVSERKREIGIRKSIGATNKQILNQFLVEGLTLSITGGIIGVIVSLIVFAVLQLYTNLDPVITVPIVALAVSISVIIGVIFSVIPALQAAHKDPINALRGD